MEEEAARQGEQQAVRALIQAELDAAGRFTPQANEAYAALTAAYYTRRAEMLGLSAEELYERRPLHVVAQGVLGEGVLNQALAAQPPKGWQHSTSGEDAARLWKGEPGMEAVFWTDMQGRLAQDAPALAGFSHSLGRSTVKHIQKNHGDAQAEASRGQVAVTAQDVARVPEIVTGYDHIRTDLLSEQGAQRVAYTKRYRDGVLLYVEDVSKGRSDMRGVTMRKYPPSSDPQSLLQHTLHVHAKSESPAARQNAAGLPAGALRPLSGYQPDAQTPPAAGSVSALQEGGQDGYYQSGAKTDAQRQFEETERAYGGKAAYDKAKAAGRTKLTYGQWVQVRTPQFKEWFGYDWEKAGLQQHGAGGSDRRATRPDAGNGGEAGSTWGLDRDTGEPRVWYHGTRDDVAAFDLNHPNRKDGGWLGQGVYVTDSADLAEIYANNKRGAGGAHVMPLFAAVRNPYVADVGLKKRLRYADAGQVQAFTKALQARGFDGVVLPLDGAAVEMVAFAPTQIKSATGNSGAFDGNDPNILHQNARGFFNPETLQIALLKNADLSTWLHESGHFFFENDIALASGIVAAQREGASVTEGEQQLLADVSALLRWHGLQGAIDEQLLAWHSMHFEERRVHHERTAESFERYLLEGNAPSLELTPYFQKFRAWLLNVYQSIKDFLGRHPEAGQLSPKVRRIFDRVLAGDEQIRQRGAAGRRACERATKLTP